MKNLDSTEYMAFFVIELSDDLENFEAMSFKINELVKQQDGYIRGEDFETTDGKYITTCYWRSLEDIKHWRNHLQHQLAIKLGKEKWFKSYKITISEVKYVLGE